MRPRAVRKALKGAVLSTAIAALLGLTLLLASAHHAPSSDHDLPLLAQVVGTLLRAFMALLLVRFVILIWFGFLDRLRRPPDAGEEHELPAVTIIVPAYNEGKVIRASVQSLLALDYPRYEIVVVDDGSMDDTYDKLKDLEGSHSGVFLRVLRKRNGGKAMALNFGIAAATSELVLCVDADSKLAPGALRAAVVHFVDPTVGAVAGNVKVVNRNSLLTRLQALEYIEGLNLARRAQSFFRAVTIIPGPFGLFRRRVLVEVGGYEGDTFAEDCDLTLKVLEHGWGVVFEPGAVAYTEAPESYCDLVGQRYRWARGILQTIRKRSSHLLDWRNRALTAAIGFLSFEGVVWPVVNLGALAYLLYLAVFQGSGLPLVLWWLQLTVLDIGAAFYCLAAEGEGLGLVPYAVVYRMLFTPMLDLWRVFATLEESLALEMSWGKVERQGHL